MSVIVCLKNQFKLYMSCKTSIHIQKLVIAKHASPSTASSTKPPYILVCVCTTKIIARTCFLPTLFAAMFMGHYVRKPAVIVMKTEWTADSLSWDNLKPRGWNFHTQQQFKILSFVGLYVISGSYSYVLYMSLCIIILVIVNSFQIAQSLAIKDILWYSPYPLQMFMVIRLIDSA